MLPIAQVPGFWSLLGSNEGDERRQIREQRLFRIKKKAHIIFSIMEVIFDPEAKSISGCYSSSQVRDLS